MINLINILMQDEGGGFAGNGNITCGSIEIPGQIGSILKTVVFLIKIGVPIILVVMGMLDMGKAVSSQKEDEIKKAQQMLMKRVIYAVLVFLIISIVQFAIGLVAGDDKASIMSCLDGIFGL